MSFHLFHINEVYSNADGSLQFIEFVGDSNGENLWAGHTLTSSNGMNANNFTFPTNLPSGLTGGKSVLVATQSFADLGLIAPDYTVPNGFLFIGNGTINFPGMIGGTISYTALPTDGSLSLNRDNSTGTNSPTNFAGQTAAIAANTIAGTNGPDNLIGTDEDDSILSADGVDTLTGNGGNDTLDGGLGIDTAVFNGNRSSYLVAGTGSGYQVSGPDGNDSMINVERLIFTDSKLAIDLNAGQAANYTVRLIGAAFGAPAIQDFPDYVSSGLFLFDSGESISEVAQVALEAMGSLSNEALVDTLYQNIVGTAPAEADLNFYVGMLQGSGGAMTQAEFLEFAANTEENALNIDLVGLQQSGVVYQ